MMKRGAALGLRKPRRSRERSAVRSRYDDGGRLRRYQFGASDDPSVAESFIPAMKPDATVDVFDRHEGKYLRVTRDEAMRLYREGGG